MSNKVLEIITELQSIGQAGLTFCKDQFDIERYNRILKITANLASLYSSKSYIEVLETFLLDTGYITPKVGVRAAIFELDKILLIKEKSDGLWSLPGGWADVNFSPSENIIKEVKEETGVECQVTKLISIYDKRTDKELSKWPHIYDLFFLCHIVGGKIQACTSETVDIGFFSIKNIPPLSVNRVTLKQIEVCFNHYLYPTLFTQFS